eukprot:9284619-Lingulodinium_polyedra.AAC.1
MAIPTVCGVGLYTCRGLVQPGRLTWLLSAIGARRLQGQALEDTRMLECRQQEEKANLTWPTNTVHRGSGGRAAACAGAGGRNGRAEVDAPVRQHLGEHGSGCVGDSGRRRGRDGARSRCGAAVQPGDGAHGHGARVRARA